MRKIFGMGAAAVLAVSGAFALAAGGATSGRDPAAPRRMNGTWCTFGTSISWYNDHVAAGRFTRGYQSRVMDVLEFDGFVNPAINGGTMLVQATGKVPKADFYTIEHGINDWGLSTQVGTMADYRGNTRTKTFYAYYRILIDRIRATNPAAKIILCTPRRGYGFGNYLPADSDAPKNGICLREYAEAVRAIAAEEGFPVADFFANCGTDAELKSLSIDVALHPNDAGYQRMADELLRAFAKVEACPEQPYPEVADEGFAPLFNGRDLTGWEGATAMYGVDPDEPGILQCYPERIAKGQGSTLYTTEDYENFILRFEFMMPTNGNNGLGVRMANPKLLATYHAMCELQLLDDGGSYYYLAAQKKDALNAYQYSGSVYGCVPSLRDNFGKQVGDREKDFSGGGSYMRRPGMWNFAEVRVIGSEIEFCLNGCLVTRADVSKFRGDGDTMDGKKHPGLHNRTGRIGWLGHDSKVRWRNIRVKRLPSDAKMGADCTCRAAKAPSGFKAGFSGCGKQLAENWKADRSRDEHWHVRNGSLFFDGFRGGGPLATKEEYADFELWADWRIMSVPGDVGLGLRGTPQVRIRDAFKAAGRPVGDWNRVHVIVRGEKVTAWLNGGLVADKVPLESRRDRSRPDSRKGRIELQGHGDPAEWRNIFIKEL